MLDNHLEQNRKQLSVLYAIILIGLIGFVDFVTGPEIVVSVFYLLPISLATWYAGRTAGYTLAVVTLLVWIFADFFSAPVFSHWAIPYWNAFVRFIFVLIVVYLLLRVRNALQMEQSLARVDSLTGLLNGRGFQELARSELSRASRNGRPLTVAYIDLDNFKKVNDTLGHDTGDELLREVSSIMKHALRQIDQVARLGGDEFTILLPETDVDAARSAVAKIQNSLSQRMTEKNWPVTASIGVLTFMVPPVSVNEMIKMVDNLMYTVKNAGKNKATFSVYRATVTSA